MNRSLIFATRLLAVTLLAGMAACSRFTPQSDRPMAEATPSGFTHGMPPSNQGPAPAWFAQRYNRARGVGEAMRRDHVTQWNKETGSYVYYVGGVLYAEYQPLRHALQIRSDLRGDTADTLCRWTEDGKLAIEPAGGEEICGQLLDELDKRIARTGQFPAIGS
ncbi:MAG: hypothetical protein AABZ84_06395 [Pseudomonadota bacterium]